MTNDEALTELIRIAAELVRRDGIPDQSLTEFKPLGRKVVLGIEKDQLRRGRKIRDCVDVIRKSSLTAARSDGDTSES